MKQPLIAVTGGTGFVGRCFVEMAAQAGFAVRALARRVPSDSPVGVAWFPGDLGDTKALARLVEGAEAVVHIAGVVNAAEPEEFTRGNVDGTLALLEAARAAGVSRFVCVSSLSAREPDLSAYGASKARAELLVKASGLDWTILRPPTVYGPRDKDCFELFRSARWGVVPVPRRGRASVIHVADLCRLLVALIPGGEAVTGKMFEPDDGTPDGLSHVEFARAIGHAVGRKHLWVLKLPRFAMEWAAKADRLLRGAKARLTLDRVGYMTHPDWVVSHAAAVPPELWRPRVATGDGLAETALWYRQQGWL